MSDTFKFGSTNIKLITYIFKKGWTDYVWRLDDGIKAAIFNIPVSQRKRFNLAIEKYYRS